MAFTLSPLLKSAVEEGLLVFFTMVGSSFVLTSTGVVTSIPTAGALGFSLLGGAIAGLRDYMTGGNASNPPAAA